MEISNDEYTKEEDSMMSELHQIRKKWQKKELMSIELTEKQKII